MNIGLKILLLLLLTGLFFSCKTSYRIKADKVKRVNDRKIIRNMMDNYVPYKTMSYKFSGEFEDSAKTTSFNGAIRIGRDSIIWVSIYVVMGVEFARIKITKDSVFFMNKFKDEYFKKGIEYIGNVFQVDLNYEMLQSIITNEIFLYAENDESNNVKEEELSADDPDIGDFKKIFKADTDSNMYVLKTHRKRKLRKQTRKNKPGLIVQSFRVIPDIYKISEADIYDVSEKRKLNIFYSKFILTGNYTMANNVKLSIADKNRKVSLTLDYNKITVDPDISFSFTIPEKYKQIQMRE